MNDFRLACHSLARNPGFTAAAVAALALGIGANTAIFSVINTVLLKPLEYPDPGRIIQFENTSPQGNFPAASVTRFNLWRQQTNVIQDPRPLKSSIQSDVERTSGGLPVARVRTMDEVMVAARSESECRWAWRPAMCEA